MMYIINKTALFCFFLTPLLFLYTSLPDVKYLINHNPNTTAFIELRRLEAKERELPFDLKWEWIPLNEISTDLSSLVIKHEDSDFSTHMGINWNNIKNALTENWRHGKIKRGGSSITQQTAKNLYLSPSKNLLRKTYECLITWQLECHLTKNRILEIYLNTAEWGNGIFGIKAAADHWFNKTPLELNQNEALYLVSILPSPLTKETTKKRP